MALLRPRYQPPVLRPEREDLILDDFWSPAPNFDCDSTAGPGGAEDSQSTLSDSHELATSDESADAACSPPDSVCEPHATDLPLEELSPAEHRRPEPDRDCLDELDRDLDGDQAAAEPLRSPVPPVASRRDRRPHRPRWAPASRPARPLRQAGRRRPPRSPSGGASPWMAMVVGSALAVAAASLTVLILVLSARPSADDVSPSSTRTSTRASSPTGTPDSARRARRHRRSRATSTRAARRNLGRVAIAPRSPSRPTETASTSAPATNTTSSPSPAPTAQPSGTPSASSSAPSPSPRGGGGAGGQEFGFER